MFHHNSNGRVKKKITMHVHKQVHEGLACLIRLQDKNTQAARVTLCAENSSVVNGRCVHAEVWLWECRRKEVNCN